MARRHERQVALEYRYGKRGVLRPGDRFRATGGPVYVTDDSRKLPMAERGVFIFHRYCVCGAARWIEAFRANGGGFVLLWVGPAVRSRTIENLRRRPYRITGKVSEGRQASLPRKKHQRVNRTRRNP